MRSVNSDIAYHFIRKRIVSGLYQPGSSLKTERLSSEIGVSRTPVRDALRQLEVDGLVMIQPHFGACVKVLDSTAYGELRGICRALESYAAELAALHRSAEDLEEMNRAQKSMQLLIDELTVETSECQTISELLWREDLRFHLAIVSAARSDLLKKEVRRLQIMSRVMAGLSSKKKWPKSIWKSETTGHREIFYAIKRGDVLSARAAMEKHTQETFVLESRTGPVRRRRQAASLRHPELPRWEDGQRGRKLRPMGKVFD